MTRCSYVLFILAYCFLLIENTLASAQIKKISILNVERELDLSSQIVRETIKYEIENTDVVPISHFVHPVHPTFRAHLSSITSLFDGKASSKVIVEDVAPVGPKGFVAYVVSFPKQLAIAGKLKFTIVIEYSHMLHPFPTSIVQKDPQFVKFQGDQYVSSIYAMKKQTTVVKLAPGSLQRYSKHQPVKLDGNKLTYGPYENIEAFQSNLLEIHYENNSPFLTVVDLLRTIEVSPWGNIAVEEHLEIVHTGAMLKGSFSRLDYQRDVRAKDKQPSVASFKTILPASAKDVYYRDEIGNISTSHLRHKSDATEIEITPRFPLFGGWKTNYYLGYNLPSYEYLYYSGNNFVLKMRFIDHIYNNYVVDKMTVKIILPEGSKDIKFVTPYPVKRLPDQIHYTYLDYTGRPVIVAQKSNLVESHIKDFELNYSFDRLNMIREPLLILAAFFLLFLIVIIYVRLDFSISDEPAISAEPVKSKTASVTPVEMKGESVTKKTGKKYQ